MEKELTKNQKIIVEEMRKNPKITIWDLGWIVNISTTSIARNIRKLKDNGYLERIGPNHRGKAKKKTSYEENRKTRKTVSKELMQELEKRFS